MNGKNIEREYPQTVIISLRSGIMGDFCILLGTFMYVQIFSTPYADAVIFKKDV